MQLRQIQEEVGECLQKFRAIEKDQLQRKREQQEEERLRRQIKESRIQITRLHYELKQNKSKLHNKQQYYKTTQNLQKQTKMTAALNRKCEQQFKQLTNVCSKSRKKIEAVESKIKKTQHELDQLQAFERYSDVYKEVEKKYWSLRVQFEGVMISTKEQDEKYLTLLKQKKRDTIEMETNIHRMNAKFKETDQNVRIQKELIDNILREERHKQQRLQAGQPSQQTKQTNEDEIQDKMAKKELDPLERIEVESIFLKKEHKAQQEAVLGRILHQRHSTQFIGRIVNRRKRSSFNISALQSSKHSKTEPTASHIKPTIISYTDENRLRQLEKNKRIRTRQTQFRKFSQQYKNLVLNNPTNQIEAKAPEKGILDVYEDLKKKQQKPITRRVSGNIEIIKLMKKDHRRKRQPSQKGSLVEPQQYKQ